MSIRCTIANGMRIAADRYEQDARDLRVLATAEVVQQKSEPETSTEFFVDIGGMSPEACEQIAKQFDLQAKEAREIADLMDSGIDADDSVGPKPWTRFSLRVLQ